MKCRMAYLVDCSVPLEGARSLSSAQIQIGISQLLGRLFVTAKGHAQWTAVNLHVIQHSDYILLAKDMIH